MTNFELDQAKHYAHLYQSEQDRIINVVLNWERLKALEPVYRKATPCAI